MAIERGKVKKLENQGQRELLRETILELSNGRKSVRYWFDIEQDRGASVEQIGVDLLSHEEDKWDLGSVFHGKIADESDRYIVIIRFRSSFGGFYACGSQQTIDRALAEYRRRGMITDDGRFPTES